MFQEGDASIEPFFTCFTFVTIVCCSLRSATTIRPGLLCNTFTQNPPLQNLQNYKIHPSVYYSHTVLCMSGSHEMLKLMSVSVEKAALSLDSSPVHHGATPTHSHLRDHLGLPINPLKMFCNCGTK